MANVDGSDVVTVLSVSNAKAIALHPCHGYSWCSHVLFLQSGPEKKRAKFNTSSLCNSSPLNQFVCTIMPSKDYCQPVSAIFVSVG